MVDKYFVIMCCLFAFNSCKKVDNKNVESQANTKMVNLERENEILTKSLNQANKIINDYELKVDKLENELMLLSIKDNPLGVYLETNFASESEYFKFGKDSLVWHSWGDQDNSFIGKWYLDGNWVMIKFNKRIGKRGIGEPLPPPVPIPGNYVDQFKEYENYIEEVTDSTYTKFDTYLDWKEVYEHISSKNEMEFFVIKNFTYNLDISKLDKLPYGKYPEASYRLLKNDDLNNLSLTELRIMRNEIFARHGYMFNSEELKSYFSKTDWYLGKRKNVDKYLSEIEEDNIKLIKQVENSK